MKLEPRREPVRREGPKRDDALSELRAALSEFAEGLHLDEEEISGVFQASLQESAERLENAVTANLSSDLARRSVSLRLASRVLLEDPSPDAMGLVVEEFAHLLEGISAEMLLQPDGARWNLARQFSLLAEPLDAPEPHENPGFVELPELLLETPWLHESLTRLAANAGVDLAATPAARGLSKSTAKRWLRRASSVPAGRLLTAVDHIVQGVEFRARQVWFLRTAEGEERPATYFYVRGHSSLFADFHGAHSESSLALEVAKLKGLTMGLRLTDLGFCFEHADWIAQYALTYLLPPSPDAWGARRAADLDRLLAGRLSRWYFYAFRQRISPVEMAATVLRMGRPLFYERIVAHALLEYSLLQGFAVSRASAASYLTVQSRLEREFEVLFDAYLLRLQHYPRLKRPEGWCAYLAALHSLHTTGDAGPELATFRHRFLKERGLHSTLDILYRTVENHSAVN